MNGPGTDTTTTTHVCINCHRTHAGPDYFRCPTCLTTVARPYRRFTAQLSRYLDAYRAADALAAASKPN